MKIKRYIAPSMRAALSMVRAEQGPDAVILSSRRGEDGIEVIAAVDYDAALFAAARRQKSLQEPEPSQEALEARQDAAIQAAALAAIASSHARQTAEDAYPVREARPAPVATRDPAPAPQPRPAPVAQATAVRSEIAPPRPVAPRSVAPAAARAPLLATSAAMPRAAAPTLIVRPAAARTGAPVTPAAAPRPPAPRAAAPAPPAPSRAPLPAPAPVTRAAAPAAPVSTPAPIRVAPAAAVAAPRQDGSYNLMQRELREMRHLLETGMAGMTWSDKRLREPLKAQVLEALSQMDIAPDVAMSIAEQTPQRSNLEDTRNIPLALLVKSLSLVGDDTPTTGGITAVVGPTGAGKTTTVAKIAARWCLKHSNRDVALVSTDAYRIGAREQLMTFARILDVNMYTANSGRELARLLARLSHKKLILIDTAGMGPRDVRLTEQLAALKLGAGAAKVLLALPAHQEGQALDEIVRAYAKANPAACIITKVDEAASLGGVLSAVIRHKLKIAYVCDGQRIPDDLHASHQRRVWLVKAAQELKAGAPRVRDEAYLARTFGRMPAHA